MAAGENKRLLRRHLFFSGMNEQMTNAGGRGVCRRGFAGLTM